MNMIVIELFKNVELLFVYFNHTNEYIMDIIEYKYVVDPHHNAIIEEKNIIVKNVPVSGIHDVYILKSIDYFS